MALIDEVVIQVQSGTGGNGCVSFRREKYVPYGGPNGGSGGDGGDVYLMGTRDKTSLLDFKYRPKFEATRGEHGMGSDCDGAAGEDLIIQVPTGTLVYDVETGVLLHDLTEHNQKVLIAKGGKGGRGNMTFATSTNRAPRRAEPGTPGEMRKLKLELRLLADVGLIGLPNAGKSSFLRAVSRATPKVADYPFTTLEPHLGVVGHKDRGFVIADLPGLIEGASEGVGLGHKFLRHVSRNRVLMHLVECHVDTDEIVKRVDSIRDELAKYDPALRERPEFLLFTKADLLDDEAREEKRRGLEARGLQGRFVSSQSGYGMNELLDALAEASTKWREPVAEAPLAAPEAPAEEEASAPQPSDAAASSSISG